MFAVECNHRIDRERRQCLNCRRSVADINDALVSLVKDGRKDNLPTISDDLLYQAIYVWSRRQGTSHALAEMLAFQRPPQSETDREFMLGKEKQFDKNYRLGNWYKKVAEKHGQNVKGKVYHPGLAAFPGDPRAWISTKGEAQRLIEERGWGCEGDINIPMRDDFAPTKDIAVAQDIIDREAEEIFEEHPEARLQEHDVKEKIFELRKPHWSKAKYEPPNQV